MKEYDATEIAYKRGYEQGLKDAFGRTEVNRLADVLESIEITERRGERLTRRGKFEQIASKLIEKGVRMDGGKE